MVTTNLAGEEVIIESTSQLGVLEWLNEPSLVDGYTNKDYFLFTVMPYLACMPIINMSITSKPWFQEMLSVLATLDPNVRLGRMGITPNGGVFRARLSFVVMVLKHKYKLYPWEDADFMKRVKGWPERGRGEDSYVLWAKEQALNPTPPKKESRRKKVALAPQSPVDPNTQWASYESLVLRKAPVRPLPEPKADADCGWLSPEGLLYPCPFETHEKLRYDLERTLGIKDLNVRWCKLAQSQSTRSMYWSASDDYVTQSQRDFIADWCTAKGVPFVIAHDREENERAAKKYGEEISRRANAHPGD